MSANLSENYRLRNYFLTTNKIPTQSLIKKKMTAPLSTVYFKSMSPKLKVMVGLEPPMQGGGGDWYVPPKDLLDGRSVLKPLNREYLSKLNYLGIDDIGMKLLAERMKRLEAERDKLIAENDLKWKNIVEGSCRQFEEFTSLEAAHKNTERIKHAIAEFSSLYVSSVNSIESVLLNAARNEIVKIRNAAYQTMKDKYNLFLKDQATTLYDQYTARLMKEKARLKKEFADNVAAKHTETVETIHDINLEKHAAIEKTRKYLECQRLACQVYVALKEREECQKDIDELKHLHKKKVKTMEHIIAAEDQEIVHQMQKEKKRLEFEVVWQKKVWHIVEKLQVFISYCLNLLPGHADFFINMEKLMLLQLNEALETPSAESIFVVDNENFEAPRPAPHPFFLFCDKGHKYDTRPHKDLCPKHCTSSASQMPVIVINKRCLYAACDNFEQFTDKAKSYIYGKRGDDFDFEDDSIYEHYVPVKYTSSQQLLELKLENSILQILQQELPNIRDVPIQCGICKTPHCFCRPEVRVVKSSNVTQKAIKELPVIKTWSAGKLIDTRHAELEYEREPKWESYMKYVEPKKCACPKTAKKHLGQHLPAYMKNVSVYDTPVLPNYETCPLATLKKLVKEARGRVTPPLPKASVSKTRDVAVQCSDSYYENLCTCFSDDELQRLLSKYQIIGSKLYHAVKPHDHYDIVDYSTSDTSQYRSQIAQSVMAFAQDAPELQEIFRTSGRAFD